MMMKKKGGQNIKKNMPTIKEAASNYMSKTGAKNISELDSIPVDAPILEENGTNKYGEDYSYNYVEFNGLRYRIPDMVLKDLKLMLVKKPAMKSFSVMKSGEGRQTRYTVIPSE